MADKILPRFVNLKEMYNVDANRYINIEVFSKAVSQLRWREDHFFFLGEVIGLTFETRLVEGMLTT